MLKKLFMVVVAQIAWVWSPLHAEIVAYVGNTTGHGKDIEIDIVDVKTGEVKESIATLFSSVYGLALDPSQKKLAVADQMAGNIKIVNLETKAVEQEINFSDPCFVVYSLTGERMYVTSGEGGTFYGYDFSQGMNVNEVNGFTVAQGCAINPQGSIAYVIDNKGKQFEGDLCVVDLQTNAIVQRINVGLNPIGIALDPVKMHAYVTNAIDENSTLTVVDINLQKVIATLGDKNSFFNPWGIQFDPLRKVAYVANSFFEGFITVFDLENQSVLNQLYGFGALAGIAIDYQPDQLLCVTNYYNNAISLIDPYSQKVIDTITGFDGPVGVAIDPTGKTAYITNFNAGNISIVDLTTKAITTVCNCFDQPHGIALDQAHERLFVTNYGLGRLDMYDLTDMTLIASIGGLSLPTGVVLDSTGTLAYVTESGEDNQVSVISVRLNELHIINKISCFDHPYDIVLSDDNQTAYVTNFTRNELCVIDVEYGFILSWIGNIPQADQVALSADGDVAYVTSQVDDHIYVIDLNKRMIKGKFGKDFDIPVGIKAFKPFAG